MFKEWDSLNAPNATVQVQDTAGLTAKRQQGDGKSKSNEAKSGGQEVSNDGGPEQEGNGENGNPPDTRASRKRKRGNNNSEANETDGETQGTGSSSSKSKKKKKKNKKEK